MTFNELVIASNAAKLAGFNGLAEAWAQMAKLKMEEAA